MEPSKKHIKIILLFAIGFAALLPKISNSQTRYWIGGTGSWTNTAKWSSTDPTTLTTSPAAVPLSTDDVIFNAASGGGTVTIPAGPSNVAKSITFLAATSMSVITGTGRLDLTDGLTLKTGMNLVGWTGDLYFYTPASVALTRTITTANNTFRNALIQFELPSSGVGGNVMVNGDFIHSTGYETINLQAKSNTVTFNNNCVFSGMRVVSGTSNMMMGFSEAITTFLRVSMPKGAINSFADGRVSMLDTDGDTNLNGGNTAAGNSYTFSTLGNLTTGSANTGTLSIVNCSITITGGWAYGTTGLSNYRRLNASGSTIKFRGSSSSFEPQDYTFNDIICEDNTSNSYLTWAFANYYVAGHVSKPIFNTIILDRNIVFSFDNTYLPATCWPTVNTLMKLTPNHRYAYTSTKGEAIGSAFRINIPSGSTLEMVGLCDKPIWLDKIAWEFGASVTINSNNVRTTNVLATNNTTPFANCSPTKPMGAGSYAVSGTSTSYAGWDISTASPAHRNLVWVGNYNNTTPTISIVPTLPLTTSTSLVGLVFTVNSPVILKSVDVYGTNTSTTAGGGNVSSIVGSSGTILGSVSAPLPVGSSNTLYTLNYNVALAPGTYTINRTTIASTARYRLNSPQTFPISLSTTSTPSVITISAGTPVASNYYNYYNWQLEDIAGNNNWYDPNNWVDVTALPTWSTNPSILPGNAGYAPTCPPTHRDSVIFPNNSYVYCDKLIQYCEGVNWMGTGRIYGTGEKDMEVWGSLYLSPQMANDFKGTYLFKSDRTYPCWITTQNQPFDLGVVFASNNALGKWVLQDSLIARNPDAACNSGFNTSSSFKLSGGHLMTGTANCTPGNGNTIEVFGMALDGGTISLFDSDVLIYGEATGNYNFNCTANKNTLVKINAGTSNIILMDKYNPGSTTAVFPTSSLSKAYFGSGHRLHEITLKKPSTGAYSDYTNVLYSSLDTIAKITAEPGTSPIFGTLLQPGTLGSTITYSTSTKAGGLVRRLDFQSTSPGYVAAYSLNTAQFPTGADNTYSVTIDSLTTNGNISFTENVNIRSYLKLAPGKAYSLGTSTTGATAISINLMGASTLSYNPFNCGAPYGASYTGASASITGNCLNYINITNGSFIANSTNTFVVDYLNITDNVVTGPNGPFNYSNSNLSGVTTGWNGVTGAARKLRWKDVSGANANSGDWNDANYWELVSGGTGVQTVIAPAPQCPPTRVDTAVFDNTSFTATNQRVNVSSALTEIASVYWQNITAGTSPQFYSFPNTNRLDVYASLAFHANMQQSVTGPILFRGQPTNGSSTFSISTITCGKKPFNNKVTFQADGANKIWSLQDSLTALTISTGFLGTSGNGSFNLIRGEFRTNGKPMYVGNFNSNSSAARKLDMTNSTITVNHGFYLSSTFGGNSWIVSGTTTSFSLVSTGSMLVFTGSYQGLIGGGKKYNNIIFKNFTTSTGIFGGGAATSITTPSVDRDTFNVVTFTGTGDAFIGRNDGSGGGPYTNKYNRFTKVIANCPLYVVSSDNTFDTLIMNNIATISTNNKYNSYVKFSNGRIYKMGSNTVQWFGNRCDVDLIGVSGSNIQMYSTTTSQQAYFRKDSTYLCADFINMRDIWAIGNGNNVASCTGYSVTGINTNCLPASTFTSHAVSSCDTITDLNSSCGPWDGINFARGRADFNAGASADLQGNDEGWAKRGYPPNPSISLASNTFSICPGQPITLTFSGTATLPFKMFYLDNGVTINKTINTVADLATYSVSTTAFTYTLAVTPTVNTQYRLGGISIDRCFNAQSTVGTGTVNVLIQPSPSGISSNFSPSALTCNGSILTLTSTATDGSTFILYPTLTGTSGAIAMVSYTTGATVSGSLNISATGNYTAGATAATYTLYLEVGSPYGCLINPRLPITFTVSPIPSIVNASSQSICSGNSATITAINSFTANVTNNWSSPSVVGITGHSTSGSTASVIETLTNTTANPLIVAYTYTPSAGSCVGSSQTFSVTVNPKPTMSSPTSATICSGNSINVSLSSDVIGTSYGWIAADNSNTTGESITPQNTSIIDDVITNTTTVLQTILYTATPTPTAGNCVGASQSVTVSVNPIPQLTNALTATICSGSSLNIGLTSNVGATYTWVAVSNSSVTGESTSNVVSNTINNTLVISSGSSPQTVLYNVSLVSNSVNCPGVVRQLTVTVNPLPTVTIVASSSVICASQSVTLTASGASTYSWTGGPTTATYVSSSAGIYTITGTSTANCTDTKTISLIVNALPSLTVVSTSSVICSVGTATFTASGASTYSWTGGPNTATYTVNTTGTYTVTGISASNCVSTKTIGLMVKTSPNIVASSINQVSCYGLNNGAVNFTNSSGTPGYTITGTNVSGTSATGLAPNNYTYMVTDAVGCTNSTTLSITQPTAGLLSSAAETATNTSCSMPNGVSTVTISGGTPNYTTTSSSGSISGNTISGLGTGIHSYTVTDANGCKSAGTVLISGASGITSTLTAQANVLCFGNTTGSISVSGLNEVTGNYTYSLTAITGSAVAIITNTTGVFTNLGQGTYSVLVKGIPSLCISSQNISVTQPTNQLDIASIATNSVLCYGGTGTATVTATGGTAPYSYTWTNNTSTTAIATYTAGTYSVSITDANGCSLPAQSFTINQPSTAISLVSILTTSAGCYDGTGTATVTATGGIAPYTYVWSNNSSTTSIATYTAGTHSVSVTDASGCSLPNQGFTISQPVSALTISSITTNSVLCYGGTGTATVIVTGGIAPYSYTWTSNGSTTSTATYMAGTYSVSATDANGCFSSNQGFTMSQPVGALTISSITTNSVLCYGGTGTTTVTATGGTAPYSYTWTSNSSTTSTATYTAGTYSVSVTDANNCSLSNQGFTMIQPTNSLSITGVQTSSVVCYGGTGTATVTATGGTAPYSYTWTNNGSTTSMGTYTVGTYSVSVTDANNCSSSNQDFIVNQPTNPLTVMTAVATVTINCGSSNATNTIIPNGGWNASYTYSLNGTTQASNVFTGLSVGSYTAQVKDALGCTTSTLFNVVNPGNYTITAVASQTALCSNAFITITPSGAVSYTIVGAGITSANTGTSFTVSPNASGSYTYGITGTNVNACVSTLATVILTVNPSPTITAVTSLGAVCAGQTTTITPSGASTYTLLNTNQAINVSVAVTPSASTIYSITGTNTLGCVGLPANISVNYNPLPVVVVSLSSSTICSGNSTTLTPSAASFYTLENTGQMITGDVVLSPNASTTYTVKGTSLFGCVNTQTALVTVITTPTVSAIIVAPIVCKTGTINLSASSSGTNTVVYNWVIGNGITAANQNQSTIAIDGTSLAIGSYSYVVSGTYQGCTSMPSTGVVSLVSTPNAALAVVSVSVCEGELANFSVQNPQAGTNYNWNGSAISTSPLYTVVASNVGSFSVTVLATLGSCTNTATGWLYVNPTPTIALKNTLLDICSGQNASFSLDNPQPNVNYVWSYNNLNGTDITFEKAQPNQSGTYTVSITDVNACKNTATFSLTVSDCYVEVPQLVTPNGDGKNDAFVVKNLFLYPKNRVQIFNRWGDIVFQASNYQNNWKGTFDVGNGALLPASTYYVIIEFNDGKTQAYRGYIQLNY